MTELEQLFAAQWATGMVPHLVFRSVPDHPYFPGPEWWDTSVSPAAPAPPVKTTGICQPPVHALALQRIWQLTPQARQPEIRARIQALYPRMVSWHRYLATCRDPEASGLVTTFHPWEATDNSPRWDRALERITVARPGPYHSPGHQRGFGPVAAAHQMGLRPVPLAGRAVAEIPLRRRADPPRVPVPDQGRVLQRHPRRGERGAA